MRKRQNKVKKQSNRFLLNLPKSSQITNNKKTKRNHSKVF